MTKDEVIMKNQESELFGVGRMYLFLSLLIVRWKVIDILLLVMQHVCKLAWPEVWAFK